MLRPSCCLSWSQLRSQSPPAIADRGLNKVETRPGRTGEPVVAPNWVLLPIVEDCQLRCHARLFPCHYPPGQQPATPRQGRRGVAILLRLLNHNYSGFDFQLGLAAESVGLVQITVRPCFRTLYSSSSLPHSPAFLPDHHLRASRVLTGNTARTSGWGTSSVHFEFLCFCSRRLSSSSSGFQPASAYFAPRTRHKRPKLLELR